MASVCRNKQGKAVFLRLALPFTEAHVQVKNAMRVVVSLVVLVGALYVLLSKTYDPNMQNWASGTIATIITYWLTPFSDTTTPTKKS